MSTRPAISFAGTATGDSQIRMTFKSGLVRVWFGIGSGVVRVWFGCGSGVIRAGRPLRRRLPRDRTEVPIVRPIQHPVQVFLPFLPIGASSVGIIDGGSSCECALGLLPS